MTRRGASALEFALVLPVLVLLLLGLLDWGWYLYNWMNVEMAANRGARIAAGIAEDPGGEALTAACATLTGYALPCDPSMVQYETDGVSSGQVTITLPFSPLIGLVPTPSTLSARASTAWYGSLYVEP